MCASSKCRKSGRASTCRTIVTRWKRPRASQSSERYRRGLARWWSKASSGYLWFWRSRTSSRRSRRTACPATGNIGGKRVPRWIPRRTLQSRSRWGSWSRGCPAGRWRQRRLKDGNETFVGSAGIESITERNVIAPRIVIVEAAELQPGRSRSDLGAVPVQYWFNHGQRLAGHVITYISDVRQRQHRNFEPVGSSDESQNI